MSTAILSDRWSLRRALVFWWGLFLLIQQGERLFLLPGAYEFEDASAEVVLTTMLTGLRADLIVASLAVLLALGLSWLLWIPIARVTQAPGRPPDRRQRPRIFGSLCLVLSVGLLVILIVDMGYYVDTHRRLDFVFFEFLGDLTGDNRGQTSQAARQTQAELQEAAKWGLRLSQFLALEATIAVGWWALFRWRVASTLSRLRGAVPRYGDAILVVVLFCGLVGWHPYGPWSVPRAAIPSSTYYTLAQNPVWYGSEVIFAMFASGLSGTVGDMLKIMPLDRAVDGARVALGAGTGFVDLRYPLVREEPRPPGVVRGQPANVLVIFVEGLDRRYLGRSLDPSSSTDFGRWFIYETPQFQDHSSLDGAGSAHKIRVTPFLDALRMDSVYVEHFFSNGTQSARGLFASFCSYYPRQGTAVMKTRYTLDYLCLPSILRRAGYQTEMVVGQNRDRNYDHIGLFLARNGLHHLFDESDFPPDAPRLGLGVTDGALFEFLRGRIEALRGLGRPFLLAAMTVGTHHPYTVPTTHPDVRALDRHADRYVAALRHLDLELETFFGTLRRDGLLDNTVVLILGDHGRHHGSGRSVTERWAGHFTVPLYIWLDPSLRTESTYRPRVVSTVASQVDVTPTILGINGLTPRVSPFVGKDLSCLLAEECLEEHFAFLTSVYDDVVGLADRSGIWFLSLRDHKVYHNTLTFNGPASPREVTDPAVQPLYERLLALYVSTNVILEENRIWSWKDLEARL